MDFCALSISPQVFDCNVGCRQRAIRPSIYNPVHRRLSQLRKLALPTFRILPITSLHLQLYQFLILIRACPRMDGYLVSPLAQRLDPAPRTTTKS